MLHVIGSNVFLATEFSGTTLMLVFTTYKMGASIPKGRCDLSTLVCLYRYIEHLIHAHDTKKLFHWQ